MTETEKLVDVLIVYYVTSPRKRKPETMISTGTLDAALSDISGKGYIAKEVYQTKGYQYPGSTVVSIPMLAPRTLVWSKAV